MNNKEIINQVAQRYEKPKRRIKMKIELTMREIQMILGALSLWGLEKEVSELMDNIKFQYSNEVKNSQGGK